MAYIYPLNNPGGVYLNLFNFIHLSPPLFISPDNNRYSKLACWICFLDCSKNLSNVWMFPVSIIIIIILPIMQKKSSTCNATENVLLGLLPNRVEGSASSLSLYFIEGAEKKSYNGKEEEDHLYRSPGRLIGSHLNRLIKENLYRHDMVRLIFLVFLFYRLCNIWPPLCLLQHV